MDLEDLKLGFNSFFWVCFNCSVVIFKVVLVFVWFLFFLYLILWLQTVYYDEFNLYIFIGKYFIQQERNVKVLLLRFN